MTISDWESKIGEIISEQRSLRQTGRWVSGPRDLLGVLRKDHHEVTHSAIIAWLLDPRMRHGLGSRFLAKVLSSCFPDESFGDLGDSWSQTEVTRGRGRADIVVWGGAAFTLLIENKVDAVESEGQCEFYFRAFAQDPNPHFVFLSPDGRPPTSVQKEAAEAYRALNYAKLAELLRDTLSETSDSKAGEARDVAESYVATLTRDLAREI